MVDVGLFNYIKNALIQSRTREDITSTLLASGNWTKQQIEEGFAAVESAKLTGRPVKIKEVRVYSGLGSNFVFLFLVFIAVAALSLVWLDRGPQLLAQYHVREKINEFFGVHILPGEEPEIATQLQPEMPTQASTTPMLVDDQSPVVQTQTTVRPAPQPTRAVAMPSPASAPTPASRKITVSSGKQAVLLYANWEVAASRDVAVYIKMPSGQVITEAQFDPSIISKDLSTVPSNTAAVVPNLSSNQGKTVVVAKPQAGIWEYGIYNVNGLGFVEFSSNEIE